MLVAIGWALGGCEEMETGWNLRHDQPEEASIEVPEPIHLLLPKEISIHPFTGTRTFDEAGGVRGIDVRIEARDYFGDPSKAFGLFRFELYHFRPHQQDPKGALIATWEVDLLEPRDNLLHWTIHRTYEFKLLWDQPIPVGQRFVLRVILASPFTQRLFAERVFVAGQ